ncbi:trafficking kinesin-binding protein 1-like [Sinocyclocheilus grahami]|uniref:trafficking kinesin-binding protein 1-like n=1 Tax=Sinocyclocheilus grahami TaxID=75366 RepID=UPI0007ACA7C6|nr:PREDICTED: trafficking kinesin-binding protein 1-like [Sinocyclocheilus grahami]
MAFTLDHSNEEYFEFDSSSEILEISTSSYISSNSADDEDNEEDAKPYTLEEGTKERDLELAARIGQSLLKKNKTLSERNTFLEEQVEHIREEVSQVRHDLSMKEELLQFYTSAAEESDGESASSTPIRRNDSSFTVPNYLPLDSLQKKLFDLEEENIVLRSEKKAKSYALENEELTQHLGAAKDAQRALTAELRELEDKYAECMEMLHEAQEELKNFRNKTLPLSTPRRFHSLGLFPMDSLAAEIEGSMRKEIQMSDPDVEEQRLHPKRVFETVRNINQTVRLCSMGPSPMNIPGSNQTSCTNSRRSSCLSTPRSSMYGGDGVEMDNRTNSMLMETQSHQDGSDDSNRKPGTPGTPGSRDLEAALRRLSLRRDNYISERRFFEEERERKLNALAEEKSELYEERDGGSGSEDGSPLTPADSIMSLGTLHSVYSIYSITDKQEEQLRENGGTPGVGSDRMEAVEKEVLSVHFPGKCMSHTSSTYTFTTCRILHPTDELTRVTPSLLSGPSPASCVMSNSSLRSTPVSTPCTPRRLSLAESFTNLRDSTKTTSTSLGLVRLLQERGISAAVYNPLSWDRADRAPPPDPCSSHTATPTHTGPDTLPSTPPNSPSKSKPTSPVFPVDYSPSDPPYETFLASRPASSILKEVREADERARKDTPCQSEVSVQNLRLVDKVKKFSLAPRNLTPGMGRPAPPFGAHTVVTSPIGGLQVLNSGMRRNRSYPAMVGASMAMKGPGPSSEDLMLAPGPPRQTSLNEK